MTTAAVAADTTSSSAVAASTITSASTSAAPTTTQAGSGLNPESAFVAELRAASILVRNDEGAIGTGQRMCEALTSGESLDTATAFGTEEHPWTPDEAKKAVTIAASTLCPENADKVG